MPTATRRHPYLRWRTFWRVIWTVLFAGCMGFSTWSTLREVPGPKRATCLGLYIETLDQDGGGK